MSPEERAEIQRELRRAQAEMTTALRRLAEVEAMLLGKEHATWRDDDSPKGENVPGVRQKEQP